MSLRAELIEANFSPAYIDRAHAYATSGKVLTFEHDPIRKNIQGKVQGTQVYTVQIGYGENTVAGFCSCPIRYNCKHVAALLWCALEAQDKKAEVTLPLPWSLTRSAGVVTPATQLINKKIIYLLEEAEEGQVPTITVAEVNLLKNGEFGAAKAIYWPYIARSKAEHIERHLAIYDLLEGDHESLRRQYQNFKLEGPAGAYALERILEEQAFYLESAQGPQLSRGDVCEIDFAWTPDAEGNYKLKPTIPGYWFFKTDPVWYFRPETFQLGVVTSKWTPRVLNKYLNAVPLPILHLNMVAKRLGQSVYFPSPPTFEKKTKRIVTPFPILRLMYKRIYKANAEPEQYLVGVPLMQYEGIEVPDFWKMTKPVSIIENNVLVQYSRDRPSEMGALETIAVKAKAVMQPIRGTQVLQGFIPHEVVLGKTNLETQKTAWCDWIAQNMPALENQGWVFQGQDLLGGEMILADAAEDYFNLEEKNNWFAAELGVMIQGEKVNLLPVLIQILKNQKDILKTLESRLAQDDAKPFYVRLESNKILGLPLDRALLFFTFLQDLYNKPLNEEGKLELSKNEIAYIALLGDANKNASLRWMGQTQFLEAAKQLCEVQSIPQLPAPITLQATLRPYQQEGFNWMHFLKTQGLSGILADDMGLGKTVQTLAYILQQKHMGLLTEPVLIVAPTSLMVNWAQEIEKFAPSLSFVVSHGKDRSQTFDRIETVDVVLTTYPLLYRDRAVLEPKMFHTIILDEAQVIKNAKAQTTLIVQNLKAKQRFCLSGTPLENHLGELWSLFHFLMPGFLGNATEFKRNYRNPIEKRADQSTKALLLRRIKPFILRRTKSQVVLELPPKTEIILRSVMDKKQRDLYETIRVSLHTKVQKEIAQQGFARSQIVILDALLKLRQICCDPRLLKAESAHTAGSAKMEQLMQILGEMIEEGRKILLFSQFASMLALIEIACREANIPYVILTGQTQDRKTPVESFQRGAVPLFLISLKAGGTGLNLTQADTVIHYDPWWNPAVERQATDRAHRIGQEKPVFVYKLITEGTVEEKIVALQTRKGALAEAILEGNATKNTLFTEADIQALFMQPI